MPGYNAVCNGAQGVASGPGSPQWNATMHLLVLESEIGSVGMAYPTGCLLAGSSPCSAPHLREEGRGRG